MDQTPYNAKEMKGKILAQKGSRTVTSKEIKTSLGWVTACLTVCADGTKLPPLFVFKGKPGGGIEREFGSYSKDACYTVQASVWTDEAVMLYWVDNVLKPYVATVPHGVIPYLILDKYR